MKNIQQNKPKLNNMPHVRTLKRINRLTKTFRTAKPTERVKLLKALSSEINQTENPAVKTWLVKFNTVLQSMEVAK